MADTFNESDLNGTWLGHYTNPRTHPNGKRFPISAELRCQSGRITGSMADEVTEIRHRYADLIERAEDKITDQQRDVAYQILHRDPEAVVELTLPRDSILSGTIDGRIVKFTKTYPGDVTQHLEIGTNILPLDRKTGHSVYYRGELETSGRTIQGRWAIYPSGLLGRFRKASAVGEFQLEKR